MPATIHDLIDQLRASSASDAECGERFERLMLAYLRTDPMWFSRFSNVWRWGDWSGREGEVDTGIDLVCEHRDGSGFTAVQCKCYAPTATLDMKDLGTFFTRSGKPPFTERIIISTTNRWTKHLQRATEGQDKPTVRITLGDLEASIVDWSQWDISKDTLRRKARKTPLPHQREAIAAVLAGFDKVDRGKAHHGLRDGQDLHGPARSLSSSSVPKGRYSSCCPSISLLSQTLKEWASDASVQLLPFAVCSELWPEHRVVVHRRHHGICRCGLFTCSTHSQAHVEFGKRAARLSRTTRTPPECSRAPDAWRVERMRYAKFDDPDTGKKVEDKTRVLYNRAITISGIPMRAHEYRLGSRSAIDWVLNQYQVTTDSASGIVNDPNDWATEHGEPRYIFDLLCRVVTVSMRTLDVVDSLPPLDFS